MNRALPGSEDEIDGFFKNKLAEAEAFDDSILHQMSWDKISSNLDILAKIPAGMEAINSATTATTQGASSIIGTIVSVKGIVAGISIIGLASSTLFYLNTKEPEAIVSQSSNQKIEIVATDSLTNVGADSSLKVANVIDIDSTGESATNDIENQKTSTEASPEADLTEQGSNSLKESSEAKQTEISHSKEVNAAVKEEAKEEKTVPESTVEIEKTTDPSGSTNVAEPAKDFREQQLEKARKKSRPLFTPQKEK